MWEIKTPDDEGGIGQSRYLSLPLTTTITPSEQMISSIPKGKANSSQTQVPRFPSSSFPRGKASKLRLSPLLMCPRMKRQSKRMMHHWKRQWRRWVSMKIKKPPPMLRTVTGEAVGGDFVRLWKLSRKTDRTSACELL